VALVALKENFKMTVYNAIATISQEKKNYEAKHIL
jgi:hypothetical protein